MEKTPLTEKAAGHISSMSENMKKLSKVNSGVKVLAPVYSEDKRQSALNFKGKNTGRDLRRTDPGKESTGRSFKSSDRSGIWTGSS